MVILKNYIYWHEPGCSVGGECKLSQWMDNKLFVDETVSKFHELPQKFLNQYSPGLFPDTTATGQQLRILNEYENFCAS